MACAFTIEDVRAMHRRTLVSLGRYRRLSDLVSSSLIFLRHNVLLRAMLDRDDLRDAPAGDWHGVPGMSVIYAHLNRLHRDHEEKMLLVTSCPGAPFVHLANLWLEGGTTLPFGAFGGGLSAMAERLDTAMKGFAPIVADAPTADAALAEAIVALDGMRGTVVCAMDVDRAEGRFLDGAATLMRTPRSALLPILMVQGRIGATPGYGAMDDAERAAYLGEMGYAVRTVEIGLQFEARLYTTLEWAWHAARGEAVAGSETTGHPLIVLKVPRSLTMPAALSTALDRNPAGFLEALRDDDAQLEAFRGWIEGYQVDELIESDGKPDKDILALCAAPEQRLARTRARLHG